jgi:hypothetical protein
MNNCPFCNAPKVPSIERSRRVFFGCESYGYENKKELSHRTDLCCAWETIRQLKEIVTTENESKGSFIQRVKFILDQA